MIFGWLWSLLSVGPPLTCALRPAFREAAKLHLNAFSLLCPTYHNLPFLSLLIYASQLARCWGPLRSKMHKISSGFTGARHAFNERMIPGSFGTNSRPSQEPLRRINGPPTIPSPTSTDSTVNLSFNVPFASSLAGPDIDDVLHSSPGALQRWSFPANVEEGTPIHKLPVHAQNVESLRRLCQQITDQSGGRMEATVTSSEPKASQVLHTRPQGLVTNVCISGDGELVHKMRAKVLNETPISMVGYSYILEVVHSDWV